MPQKIVKEIVQEGKAVLRKKAKFVAPKDIPSVSIQELVAGMKKLLARENNGVGLAAPQVGASWRLFIISGKAFIADEKEEKEKNAKAMKEEKDIAEKPPSEKPVPSDMVFINPELVRKSRDKREMAEGCLSVRGKYGTVMRSEKATVRALSENGAPFTYHGSGLIAHIFQHELDHLDGILYTDKALKLEDEEEKQKLREKFPAGEKQKRPV